MTCYLRVITEESVLKKFFQVIDSVDLTHIIVRTSSINIKQDCTQEVYVRTLALKHYYYYYHHYHHQLYFDVPITK